MANKKRCQFHIGTDSQCSSPVLRIVGDCPHCRAQFCGAVSVLLVSTLDLGGCSMLLFSTVFLSIMSALIWKIAGSRRLIVTSRNWRANGRSHLRLLRPKGEGRHLAGSLAISVSPRFLFFFFSFFFVFCKTTVVRR